ncbi:hypothetical protein GCM10007877_19590 [Marinibactrum halimedae]|uniref:Uncharacterized protein n=1 Tax=Marinibactrum halimedae TaxID=1444977 RepID=A0AA37T5Y4_9GAMM|nr:AAA family ATPase [Marinibactrum halimedae]GLS26244.1 hypothetical protein GCM10007877_19590 [Marinibactrum halimedae]
MAKDRFKDSLRRKAKVIWDATNLRSDFRSMIIELAEAYHALVTMVVFLLPEDELLKADQQRQYSVGSQVLRAQIDSYQFPLVNECHRMIVVGVKGKECFRTGFVDDKSIY